MGTTAIFKDMKYSQIEACIEKRDSKMKLKPAEYEAMKQKFKKDNPIGYDFLVKSVGPNDENGLIDTSLRTMGITWETLAANPDRPINEEYPKYAVRFAALATFMEKNVYSRIDP